MEAQMLEESMDRRRFLIPSIVVTLVIAGIIVAVLATRREAGATTNGASSRKNGKEGAAGQKAPIPVSVAAASPGIISSYVSATANLVAENEVKIVAEAEGRVAQLLAEEGQSVRRGQPLAALVRDDADIALAKARVRARNAQVTFDRARDLRAKELLSQGDFDKARLEKDVADQELAEAQWRVGKTIIRAPFDGGLTDRVVNLGQHVRPGDELFTVTDFTPLIARIYLPEKDVLALDQGREVRLRLKAAEEVTFAGRIRQISPVVDPATGTVKVTVEAVNPPPMVRPGAFVSVDIVRESKKTALLIPREAVVRELQDAHVFVAAGALAKKREISTGLEEGPNVEVLSGLTEGDRVIVAGQGGLKEGSRIRVVPNSASK